MTSIGTRRLRAAGHRAHVKGKRVKGPPFDPKSTDSSGSASPPDLPIAERDITERLLGEVNMGSGTVTPLRREAALEIQRLRNMLSFSQLTPAEAERLAMLAEECGEVVQVVGKILRHGYESCHPDDPSTTNRQLLEKELLDLGVVEGMMHRGRDVDTLSGDSGDAVRRKLRYTHHQEDQE